MALFKKTKTRKIPSENIIVLDQVSKSYATGAPALNGVSLTIKQGEFVFVVGDSGSGKSTLIKLLLRELTPTSGDIYVNGQSLVNLKRRNVPKYRRNLGVVFQDFRLLKDRNVFEKGSRRDLEVDRGVFPAYGAVYPAFPGCLPARHCRGDGADAIRRHHRP